MNKKCEFSINCNNIGLFIAKNKEFKNKIVCLDHLFLVEDDLVEIQNIIENSKKQE